MKEKSGAIRGSTKWQNTCLKFVSALSFHHARLQPCVARDLEFYMKILDLEVPTDS
jgi:hypothetical protein